MRVAPKVVVLAGPNGAGKTAPILLRDTLAVREFVNADTIAQGLSAFGSDAVALQAGRIMLGRIRALAAANATFAFESTLASRSFAPWIAGLLDRGYTFHLLFLWLPSPAMAMARVRERVRMGGHNVPEETIKRRYAAGLRNFFAIYMGLATWRFYDNSDPHGPRLLAQGTGNTVERIIDVEIWTRLAGEWKRA